MRIIVIGKVIQFDNDVEETELNNDSLYLRMDYRTIF